MIKAFLHAHPAAIWAMNPRDKRVAIVVGAIGGFIVGLTSVGSGTFFGLAMLVMFPIAAAQVVGTDIFHAAALLWVAGFGHLVAGNVDLHATGWLLIGSIPGVLIGGHFTVQLPDRTLRVALATTLFLSGVKLVDFPGADAVVVTGAVGAVTAAAIVSTRALLVQRARRLEVRAGAATETT
jgi:uncharacterized membrane protein YfcA